MHIMTQSFQEGDFISSRSGWNFIRGVREDKQGEVLEQRPTSELCLRPSLKEIYVGNQKNGLMRKARLSFFHIHQQTLNHFYLLNNKNSECKRHRKWLVGLWPSLTSHLYCLAISSHLYCLALIVNLIKSAKKVSVRYYLVQFRLFTCLRKLSQFL